MWLRPASIGILEKGSTYKNNHLFFWMNVLASGPTDPIFNLLPLLSVYAL